MVTTTTNKLQIAFLNVNGLSYNKIGQLISLTTQNDLVFLAETWSLSLHAITQHPTFISHSRGPQRTDLRRADGGICCLANPSIRDKVTVIKRTDYSMSVLLDGKVRIACVYLPPSMSADNMESVLGQLPQSDIVIGDFNTRFGNVFHDNTTGPRARMDIIGMWQTKNTLQHIIPSNQTRNDHVFSQFPGTVASTKAPCATDHLLIQIAIQIPNNLKRNSALLTLMSGTKRLHLRKLDDTNVRNRLIGQWMAVANQNMNNIENAKRTLENCEIFWKQKTIDQAESFLKNSIFECGKKSLGLYNVDIIKGTKPPVARLSDNPSNSHAVRLFKLACRPSRRILESNKEEQSVEENVLDHFNNVYCRSPSSNCNIEHFRFPKEQGLSEESLSTFGNHSATSFANFISVELVKSIISKYDNTKACGEDSIHNRLLLALINTSMVDALVQLFKLCALHGITPSRWNTSLMHPLPKSNDANTIDKCRPIAISVMFRRIFESCLLRYWYSNNSLNTTLALSPLQGGFRRGFSTITHACASNDAFYLKGKTHRYRCFIDLKQAYDRVPLEALFHKLRERMVDRGEISLITSLFGGCSTIPVINGRKLRPVQMLRGLFQGSILSPMLFNIFIDDLSRNLSRRSLMRSLIINHLLLADDLQLIAETLKHLEELLQVFNNWAMANGMEPCASKSGLTGPSISCIQRERLQLGGEPIPIVHEYKYVGFMQDKNGINWASHFKRLLDKATKLLSFCQANGSSWPEWVKLMIYKSFIRPSFEYGAPLVVSIPPQMTTDIFQQLNDFNSRCLKWIVPYGSNTTIISTVIGLPTIQNRFKTLACLFVQHLNTMNSDNPCTRITAQLQESIPWVANVILPRAQRNQLYKDMIKQVTPDLTMRTLIRRWNNEKLTNGSRTGQLVQHSRVGSSGPDFTVCIRDRALRQAALSWRTNSWGLRRICPSGHIFRKSCISNCLSEIQQLQPPTRIDKVPHFSSLDDALYSKDLSTFQELLAILDTTLL